MNFSTRHKWLLKNKFSTTIAGRYDIINAVRIIVHENHLSPAMSDYELTLIVDEAITNAMEHGNNWDPDKMITVSARIDNKSLYISIEDEGPGFDFRNYKSECVQGNKLADRGRGLMIINHFCKPRWKKSGKLIELVIALENNQKAV
jgi:anti-sigma regulatory factor (Ser/Thr protein kinase)